MIAELRKPGSMGEVASTPNEFLRIALEKDERQLEGMSIRDLEKLIRFLNRIRYELEEQEEFIRFFLLVHHTLVKSREGVHWFSP